MTIPPLTPSHENILQRAVTHHRLGQFFEAEKLYRDVLQAYPQHPEANHNLGVLALQAGQPLDGIPYLKTAFLSNSQHPDYVTTYAEALLMANQADEALSTVRNAMEQGLNTPEIRSLRNRIQTIRTRNSTSKSLRKGRPSKNQQPLTETEYHSLVALFNTGCYAELENCARSLAKKYPDSGIVWSVLGASLGVQGKESLGALRRAVQLLPNDHEAHNNLGNALQDLGEVEDAVTCYLRALTLNPNFAKAHVNLGIAQRNLGQLKESIESFHRALAINPDNAETYSNLGNTLVELGRFEDATTSFRQALAINPSLHDASSNLLFANNYLPNTPVSSLLTEAQEFNLQVTKRSRPYTSWPNAADPDRCLRVGIVSGDLRTHAVGFFVEGVLGSLAANAADRLDLFAFYNHPRVDALSERIKACCSGWHSVRSLSDEQLARKIREDGIDILIDLSGHTAHNRLSMFAWKPAPVQATWLGYLGTTGVSAIDYLIADATTLPESEAEEANFTETIWRLPESYLCFTPPDVSIDLATLPALENGYITFGSFNNLSKVNDSVISLWARALNSVPDSRLYLKTKQLGDASVRQRITQQFSSHGISAERLILESTVPSRTEHFASYQRIDIAFDPFPYTGITTSVESLWMGVPVLTLSGSSFLSRQGVGLLMNAGLPDWIALNEDDFVAKTVFHASDLQQLASLRAGLRQQVLASPIFDAPRFARNFEAALRGMWKKWCKKQETPSS